METLIRWYNGGNFNRKNIEKKSWTVQWLFLSTYIFFVCIVSYHLQWFPIKVTWFTFQSNCFSLKKILSSWISSVALFKMLDFVLVLGLLYFFMMFMLLVLSVSFRKCRRDSADYRNEDYWNDYRWARRYDGDGGKW